MSPFALAGNYCKFGCKIYTNDVQFVGELQLDATHAVLHLFSNKQFMQDSYTLKKYLWKESEINGQCNGQLVMMFVRNWNYFRDN